MKLHITILTIVAVLASSFSQAEGPLTPPGAPAPTMKSLQEIWDKLGDLETRLAALEGTTTATAEAVTESTATTTSETESMLSGLAGALGLRASYTWTTSIVDTSTGAGKYSSLAYDPLTGQPAIAYYNSGSGTLRYAQYDGSSWDKESITLSGGGTYISLAFSESGQAGISCYSPHNDSLVFAARPTPGSTFLAYSVDTDASTTFGMFTSVKFGSDGKPAIAYRHQGQLKIARFTAEVTSETGIWNSSNWDITSATSTNQPGYYNSLAFGPDGYVYVAHCAKTQTELYFASETDIGIYNNTYVDGNVGAGVECSMVFLPNGHPAISYYDETNHVLKYAEKSGSTWTLSTVDSSSNDVGRYTSIAYNSTGEPAISYYDVTNGDLKYAQRSPAGTWRTSTVDSDGDVGQYTSLAFDTHHRPTISYYDNTNGKLKFAKASRLSFSPSTP